MYLSNWGIPFWIGGLVAGIFVAWWLVRKYTRIEKSLESSGKTAVAEYLSEENRELKWTLIALVVLMTAIVAAVWFSLN